MKKSHTLLTILLLFTASMASANEFVYKNPYNITEAIKQLNKEKKENKKQEKTKDSIRRGWTFGILPSVAYDADKGFQGGLLSNVYYFGDGSQYPDYIHSFYVEAAYTTKHSGLFRFNYDSKYLIPKHRMTVDISYLPDATCDFIGYNGYQSVFNSSWGNLKSEDYISRMFYKSHRDMFRTAVDFSGTIKGHWYWNAGIGLNAFYTGSCDLKMLNGKRETTDKKYLNEIEGLYEKYRKWGIIGDEETGGAWHPYLRAGVTYDTRNKQQNPNKGIYTDAFFTYTAAFGRQKKFNNLMFNINFRHYVPVYKDYINFAYRLSAQVKVAGEVPFYLNNTWNTLFIQRVQYEALGGGNTLRGIARHRITANGFAFANIEFRFKVCKFSVKKEHFYIGLNPFLDAGIILQPYKLDEKQIIANIKANDPEFNLNDLPDYIKFKDSQIFRPHCSAGLGLKIAMNENFVLSVDWAAPLDKRDNGSMANFYVKMNYMF